MSEAVHIVIRSVGVYELDETPIRAFTTARGAANFARTAEAEWALATSSVPDDLDYPPDGAPDSEWERWAASRKRAWKRFRRFLTCDRAAGPVGEWESPAEPSYFCHRVPLTRSEIEAPPAAHLQTALGEKGGG